MNSRIAAVSGTLREVVLPHLLLNVMRGIIWAKRFLVLFAVAVFLWFAIGGWLFPDWYYEFLWSKDADKSFVWGFGIEYWLDNPILPIGVAGAAVVLFVFVRRYRAKFLPVLDKVANTIFVITALGICLIAWVVYQYESPSLSQQAQQIAAYNAAIQQLQKIPQLPRKIQPPIDFQYVDNERVKALYDQIEPTLVEQRRTVATSSGVTGSAGLKVGVVEGGVEGTKRQESTSTYESSPPSPERDCIEVMNYVLQTNGAPYYTDVSQWIGQRAAFGFQKQVEDLKKNFSVNTKPKSIPQAPQQQTTEPSPTKEEQEAAQLQLKQYEQELDKELSSLQGEVIVDGDFVVSRLPDGGTVFTERFADNPRRVLFRAEAPSTPDLSRIASIRTTHLHLFGTILRPLGDEGFIEIRPIAIF